MRSKAIFIFKTAYLLLIAIFLLGPIFFLFGSTLFRGDFETLQPDSAHDQARLSGMWWATVRITLYATGIATILGVLVALGIDRARGAYRKFLETIFPIPLLVPPVIVAISWTHVLGKRGIAFEYWHALTNQTELPFSIYGEVGSAVILACCWFPLVTMPTLVGLRAVGSQFQRAGRIYAGWWHRTWTITRPLLTPYVTAGSIFVAWLVLGDFDVPSVFLDRTAYPIEIFAAFQINPNIALALKRSMPLLALSGLVLISRQLLVRGTPAATMEGTWRPSTLMISSGSGNVALHTLTVLILAVAVVMPVLALIHQVGAVKTFQAGIVTAKEEVLNSFKTALAAALTMLLLAAPYAFILKNSKGFARIALAVLAMIPLGIPGTVHGVAWSRTLSATDWGQSLLKWDYVASTASVARFFPFAVYLLAAVLEGLHRGLFNAAKTSGAGLAQRTLRIGFPLAYPGILAVFAIGFALSIGELSTAILINPVGFSTLPVRISSLLHFGKDDLLAGLCLIQIFLAMLPYMAVALLLERALEVRLG